VQGSCPFRLVIMQSSSHICSTRQAIDLMETFAVILSSTAALIALAAMRGHNRQTEIPKLP
jgi:hypothetical protein